MARLVLSDGTREIDLIGTPPNGIYLVDFDLPAAQKSNLYARGADQEGSTRIRSIADNVVSDGLALRIDRVDGTGAQFWNDVNSLQDLVASAHRNKGTLTYEPDEVDGVATTYDLESIEVAGLPQNGRQLAKRICEPVLRFERKPYGRLAPVTLVSGEVISGPLDSFDAVIPGHEDAFCELTLTDTSSQNSDHIEVGVDYQPVLHTALLRAMSAELIWALDEVTGATDLSGNGHDGTAQGGLTFGGYAGSPITEQSHSTDFDGTDDYVSSDYRTYRNLHRNPSVELNAAGYNVSAGGGWTVERDLDIYSSGTPNPDPTQRHPNPEVETNSTGWSDDSTSGGVVVTALNRSTAWSYSGDYSMHIKRSNAGDAVNRSLRIITSVDTTSGIAAVAGDVIRCRAHLNIIENNATINWRLQVRWRNAAGTILSTDSGTALTTGADGEQELESNFTAPANTATFSVFVTTSGANQWTCETYIDSLFVTKNESLPGASPLVTPEAWPTAGEMFLAWRVVNADADVQEAKILLAPGSDTASAYAIPVTPEQILRLRCDVHLLGQPDEGHEVQCAFRESDGTALQRPVRSNTYRTLDNHVCEMTFIVPEGAAYAQPIFTSRDSGGPATFDGYLDAVCLSTPVPDESVPYDPERTLHLIGDMHWEDDPEAGSNLNSDKVIADVRLNELDCMVRIDVGDTVDHGLPDEDTYAQDRFDSMDSDVPIWHVMGNHDVQLDVRTAEDWAAAWGYADVSYVLNLSADLRLIMLSQSDGFTRVLNAADLAWLEARLAEDDRPTWIVNHYPIENTLSGDGDRHFLTTDGTNHVQPTAGVLALLDEYTHVVGWISGHTHPAIDEQDGWLGDVDVGSRNIVHVNCPAPAYTAYGIAAQLGCYSLFLEILEDGTPRFHLRDHDLQAWVDNTQPKELTEAAYLAEQPAYVPGPYWDGTGTLEGGVWTDDPGGHVGWVGTAQASASDKGVFANGTSRTIAVWAARDDDDDVYTLWGSSEVVNNTYLALDEGSQDVALIVGVTTYIYTAAWPADTAFHHAVLVFDEVANVASLYIDGLLFEAKTGVTAQHTAELSFSAGLGPAMFDGKEAQVAVWERALTASDVRQLYLTGQSQYRIDGDYLALTDANGNALAGSTTTRAGSISTNIVRATLTTTPVVVCSTGPQPHTGKKKIRTRVYESAATCWVRCSWRSADARFQPSPWREIPATADWFDIALEVVDIAEVPEGVHSWEAHIEAYTDVPGTTIDVDHVEILPADVYAKARMPGSSTPVAPNAFTVADEFDQSAGNLDAPKAARVGGNWAEAGETGADGFQTTGAGKLTRTTVSDASLVAGSYATVGSAVANCAVRADVMFSAIDSASHLGVLARYVDTDNWLKAVIAPDEPALRVEKRVGGGATTRLGYHVSAGWAQINTIYQVYLTVDATGQWAMYIAVTAAGSPVKILSGQDADLATGGALDDGKIGLYDAQTSATAITRTYDNFAAWAPTVDHALYSGQSAKLLSDRYLRQNGSGSRYGKLPIEGNHLRVRPSSENDEPRRIVVKRRRLDNDGGQADEGTSDALTADLVVTGRVALLG